MVSMQVGGGLLLQRGRSAGVFRGPLWANHGPEPGAEEGAVVRRGTELLLDGGGRAWAPPVGQCGQWALRLSALKKESEKCVEKSETPLTALTGGPTIKVC
jgi:hypothetical protein